MKNIPDEHQRWINEQIRKVPERPNIKAVSEEKQELFTHLCRLQQESHIEYIQELKKLQRWNFS